MTPEDRAAQLLRDAHELGLLDGSDKATLARWHSITSTAFTAAICEARDRCQSPADRIAIGDLMIGEAGVAVEETGEPNTLPGTIECPNCRGEGCQLCNGVGRMGDSGPMPADAAGEMAFKPACGCATDWLGEGASEEAKLQRRAAWADRGWSSKPIAWRDASGLLTAGHGCQHSEVRP